MRNHKREWQPRIRRNGPILAVILVVLILFIISGGVGLALLIAGQRSATPPIIVSRKQVNPFGLSPQQLYTRITSSPPTITDPLTHADMLLWVSNGHMTGCTSYNQQGMVLEESKNDAYLGCLATAPNLSDFAFQVKMSLRKGSEVGIIFRFAEQVMNCFTISQEGTFSLFTNGNPLSTLLHRSDPSIKVGAGQSNVLTLIAQGHTFLLYTNGHYLGQVTTSSIPTRGYIGLVVFGFDEPEKNATFSDMRVWKL